MTRPGARVGEAPAGRRHELPRVAGGVQGQLQDAPGGAVEDLLVGCRGLLVVQTGASRAYHELADPARGVEAALVVLRSEPFIVMLVPRYHDLAPGVLQLLHTLLHQAGHAVPAPRAACVESPVGR